MLIVINNCRCTKNDDSNFNLNNLINYLNENNYAHCVIKTHAQFNKCFKNNDIKGLILTGSPNFINQDSFKDFSINLYAINNLKNKVPILGICYGSQLINILNGGKIHHMNNKIKGNFDVNIVKNDTIFNLNLKKNEKLSCAFNFYDQIKTIPKNYKIISSFVHNNIKFISGFSNETDKIYCLLFHPETNKRTHKILNNFMLLCNN